MGSIDKLPITDYSEAAKKKDNASVAKAIAIVDNEDLGGDSDGEPPKFLYDYRGKAEHRAAGLDTRSKENSIRPDKVKKDDNSKKKVEMTEQEQKELDELEKRAKAKADKKKN